MNGAAHLYSSEAASVTEEDTHHGGGRNYLLSYGRDFYGTLLYGAAAVSMMCCRIQLNEEGAHSMYARIYLTLCLSRTTIARAKRLFALFGAWHQKSL